MFDFGSVDIAWYWVLTVVLVTVALLVALYFGARFFQKKRGLDVDFTTKDITYAAVCIAIAYALSFFGYTLPNGGTVTAFSTIPIMMYCYFFGFRKGLMATTVYMLLQLLQNPSIIHPFSAVLDYVLPYMALSIVGLFAYNKNREHIKNPVKRHYPIFIGMAIYIVIRYLSHVLSGVLFWHMYTPDEYSVWGYSAAYNSFALIDFAIAMVAAVPLLCSKAFNTVMTTQRDTLQNPNPATKHD